MNDRFVDETLLWLRTSIGRCLIRLAMISRVGFDIARSIILDTFDETNRYQVSRDLAPNDNTIRALVCEVVGNGRNR